MDADALSQWIRLLRAVADGASGHPPHMLAPWFQFARGLREAPEKPAEAPDDRLWRALAWGDVSLVNIDSSGDEPAPLFPFTAEDTIEIWTERDLSAMHALWRLARAQNVTAWRSAVMRAADWHLEHTQPDNATGRPWAIHVFAERWIARGDVESRLYAETLLHNCQMQTGFADPLSAEILRDAADALCEFAESDFEENQA